MHRVPWLWLSVAVALGACSESSEEAPGAGGTSGAGASAGSADAGSASGRAGAVSGGRAGAGESGSAGSATGGGAGNASAGKGAGGMGGPSQGGSPEAGSGEGAAAGDAAGESNASGGTDGSGGSGTASGAWLHTKDNRILTSDDLPFRGRGANLHDTRSCDACTWLPPNPDGLKRWADELIDNWHANFIRFNLWAFEEDGGFRLSFRSLVEDEQYYADIQEVVNHMTSKPGVYVMVTLFIDPSMEPDGGPHATWPTTATLPVYQKLAEAFVENPQVLFGLMNEPHDPESENDALAAIFRQAIDTIRAVESANGTPQHIIVAQGTQNWARETEYWILNPLGENIAYEVHCYNPPSDFGWMIVEPSQSIPLLIGEFGHSEYQTIEEAKELMALAEANDVPWIAWNFHQRCAPNLLEDEGGADYDGCGFEGAGTDYTWPVSEWGQAVKERLAMPW
jgi:hypothetical protein